jgi:hypothetical protein
MLLLKRKDRQPVLHEEKSRLLVGEYRFSASACQQEVWQALQFFRIVLIRPNKRALRPSP